MSQPLQTSGAVLKTPVPHQAEALAAIDSALLEQDRATVVMACGTGKTLLEMWAAQAQDKKRTVVFVPSLSLLNQVFHEWQDQNNSNASFRALCVCSDSSVGRSDDEDEMRLQDLDFPTCTDPKVVNAFLDSVDGQDDATGVIFCTYQSAAIVGQAMSMRGMGDQSLGLAIFDEAHKTVGDARGVFSYALNDQNLQIDKRLFFTATPRMVNSRRARDENGDLLISSMDDEAVYGEHVYTLSFAEAAQRDIIVPYKVVISVIDDAAITNEQIAASVVHTGDAVLEASELANQIALRRTMETYGLKKAISFHTTVDSAQQFSHGFANHGFDKVETLHVSGRQSSGEREAVMRRFRDAERSVISNARCLTEGVDVPSVDLVAFMDPRKSKVDIVQAAGRAMRKAGPEKDFGYILIPLHLNIHDGESPADALARSDFSAIADVLSALSESDESLHDIIRDATVREGAGERGRLFDAGKDSRIEIDMPGFGREVVARERLLEAIETRLIGEMGCSFDRYIGKLQAYKAQYGHCNVSSENTVGGEPNPYARLGQWCGTQRQAEKNGTLTPERKDALVKLGFSWDRHEKAWQEMFTQLQAYKAQYGHCDVSGSKTVDGEPNLYAQLGRWCGTQRQAEKDGKLTPERKEALVNMGFSWDPLGDIWQEMFTQLQAYKAQYGHCEVSSEKTLLGEPNPHAQLGMWCGRQRQDEKDGKLTPERKEALVNMGFSLDPLEDAWQEMFTQLQAYKAQYGHCEVSSRKIVGGEPNPHHRLGMWCSSQRQDEKDSKLTPERKEALNNMGFSWDLYEKAWQEMFAQLKIYEAKHRHCDIPSTKTVDGEPNLYTQLGQWCITQRQDNKNGKLTPERKEALDKLGFSWDPLEDAWQEMFTQLQAYKAQYGHCEVSSRKIVGGEPNPHAQLGRWCGTQRQVGKDGTLAPERLEKLEALGFRFAATQQSCEQDDQFCAGEPQRERFRA